MPFQAWLNNLESAKWIFAGLYIVSTIGVTFGVDWEDSRFPEAKRKIGHRVLVWALIADTFFTILIFATDGWISKVQNDEIIALETRLAPRLISEDARKRIAAKMTEYGGQQYTGRVASDVPDAWDLWREISAALDLAGWHWTPPSDVQVTQFGPPAGIAIAPLPGVMVMYPGTRFVDLHSRAEALATAITAEGVASGSGPASGVVDLNPNAITIVIGPKPQQ
jgi:hypothetical protein